MLETIQRILDNGILSDNEIVKTEQEPTSESYSLTTLKEFLGSDNQSSKEFIESFMESTKLNLNDLEKAITEENEAEIHSIAHRIAPMFRQIQAHEIGEILKTLEETNFENSNLKIIYNSLKTKIYVLFEALKREIN